ncbi:FecR family protein [Prolixibacter denitrificans]|uniref:Anti-sigma factor n=1 Tax=Prolixibacter denitrificans TaxID=1541063 RepID=A0A2P8C7D7_9BACT|nr:FecR family protein [Prolixibacter denitrificans]PSK80890.1 FecR protein [Prolixibacter denitrificans]GET22294.1 anti-sigma factor [Prolixibacter denitrificans]
MKKNLPYNDNQFHENSPDQYPKIEYPYSRSKEDVWEALSKEMNAGKEPEKKVRRMNPYRLAAAAVIIVLLATTAFLRFYSQTVNAPAGQHVLALLPDSSTVNLNAGSSITYHPYWWKIARTVKLNGEGFFEVQKGSRFDVVSKYGEVTVLGTSFNIYARGDDYKVTCFTGKVRVESIVTRENIILHPDQHAYLEKNGNLKVVQHYDVKQSNAWMHDMFIFTGTPIKLVFQEIERQYNVQIKVKSNLDYTYSGNFTRNMPVIEVLQYVCEPFGLTFVKQSKNVYQIEQSH